MAHSNFATINIEDAAQVIERMRQHTGPKIKDKQYKLKNGESLYLQGDGGTYSSIEDKIMLNGAEQQFKKTAAADRLRAKLAKRQAERAQAERQ